MFHITNHTALIAQPADVLVNTHVSQAMSILVDSEIEADLLSLLKFKLILNFLTW